MSKATIRGDGEHYTVYHNGYRLSGQYPLDQARERAKRINTAPAIGNGCICTDCVKERAKERA